MNNQTNNTTETTTAVTETMNIAIYSKKDVIKCRRHIESEQIKVIKTTIGKITEELQLDADKMDRRISAATSAKTGRVAGLSNLLSSVVSWPAENGEGSLVSANQKILEDQMGIDIYLAQDIKTAKGYHTWLSDELDIIEGQEPDFDQYAELVEIMLEELGVEESINDALSAKDKEIIVAEGIDILEVIVNLDEATWKADEAKAIIKAKDAKKAMEEAAAEYDIENDIA